MTENEPKRDIKRKKDWIIPGGKLRIVEEVWHVRETRLRPSPLETRENPEIPVSKTIFNSTSTDGE